MPFYEYQCKSCGHDVEVMQKISDPPLKKCPECGKSQLQRLMSAPVFRLKGGGWYETDFKSDKDNQRNLAERPEAEAPKDKDKDRDADAKTDTKDGAATIEAKGDATSDKPSANESAKVKEPAVAKSREKTAPSVKKPSKKRAHLLPSKRGNRSKGKSTARRRS